MVRELLLGAAVATSAVPSIVMAKVVNPTSEDAGFSFDPNNVQALMDEAGMQGAQGWCGDGEGMAQIPPDPSFEAEEIALESPRIDPAAPAANSGKWIPVTSEVVRAENVYSAPLGYKYALGGAVDFNRDNYADYVQIVSAGQFGGILLTYGLNAEAPQLLYAGEPLIYGEGIFIGSPTCFVLNSPEVGVSAYRSNGSEITVEYSGH